MILIMIVSIIDRGVAQSGSAPALGAGCREFESLRPDQYDKPFKLHLNYKKTINDFHRYRF